MSIMDFKITVVVLAVLLIQITTACPRRISPYSCGCPQKKACFSNIATPSCYGTIDYIQKPCCNDQLILPPLTAELPYGLGYFSSALPFVAKSFNPALDYLTTGAYLPVVSECDNLVLAAPISPDLAPLVKPIIL